MAIDLACARSQPACRGPVSGIGAGIAGFSWAGFTEPKGASGSRWRYAGSDLVAWFQHVQRASGGQPRFAVCLCRSICAADDARRRWKSIASVYFQPSTPPWTSRMRWWDCRSWRRTPTERRNISPRPPVNESSGSFAGSRYLHRPRWRTCENLWSPEEQRAVESHLGAAIIGSPGTVPNANCVSSCN